MAKKRLKSAVDVVPLLHRKAVTIGEVVAHVIPFNSVSSLEAAFGSLLEADFKMLVANVRNPYHVRNGDLSNAHPLIPSADDL